MGADEQSAAEPEAARWRLSKLPGIRLHRGTTGFFQFCCRQKRRYGKRPSGRHASIDTAVAAVADATRRAQRMKQGFISDQPRKLRKQPRICAPINATQGTARREAMVPSNGPHTHASEASGTAAPAAPRERRRRSDSTTHPYEAA